MANQTHPFEITNQNTPAVRYLLSEVKATFEPETGNLIRPDKSLAARVKYSKFEPMLRPHELAWYAEGARYDKTLTVEELIADVFAYQRKGSNIVRPDQSIAARAREATVLDPQWTPAEYKGLIEMEKGKGYGGMGTRPTEVKVMGLALKVA